MTLSPYKKYIVMARKYQFSDLVNGRFFLFAGTWAILMTSLKQMTCMAVIRNKM